MMKHRAFTLMEMLVVLAVIGALAGIAIPVGRSVIARSREATCLNQLRSLGVALESYLQDHQRILPPLAAGRGSKADAVPVIETVLLPYVNNREVFQCPADTEQYAKSGCSYFWNSTQSGLRVSDLAFFGIKDRPDRIPLITDKESWHPGGTNFLYADLSSSNKIRFAASN